jgi:hypothetical protein
MVVLMFIAFPNGRLICMALHVAVLVAKQSVEQG